MVTTPCYHEMCCRAITYCLPPLCFHSGFKYRAPRAVKEVKKFAQLMMGTKDNRVDQHLNQHVWSKGVRYVLSACCLFVCLSMATEPFSDACSCLLAALDARSVARIKGAPVCCEERAQDPVAWLCCDRPSSARIIFGSPFFKKAYLRCVSPCAAMCHTVCVCDWSASVTKTKMPPKNSTHSYPTSPDQSKVRMISILVSLSSSWFQMVAPCIYTAPVDMPWPCERGTGWGLCVWMPVFSEHDRSCMYGARLAHVISQFTDIRVVCLLV